MKNYLSESKVMTPSNSESDISSASDLEKFLLDGMLGSMATKLRILGYDTLYDKQSDDRKLILIAKEKGRILVTSDKALYLSAKQHNARSVLLTGKDEQSRLFELFKCLGLRKLDLSRISRCSECNSVLVATGSKDEMSRPTFRCPGCGKLYWRGSHWKKLNALFSDVNHSLATFE